MVAEYFISHEQDPQEATLQFMSEWGAEVTITYLGFPPRLNEYLDKVGQYLPEEDLPWPSKKEGTCG